ncbi:sulfotransferase family protein [Salinibacter grassmerensis]|uniref:sulfotransferase family protein n=1 Tax=Salinibacter grassmerensis TaxID=3040353 RepID=UPI0021E6E160|nr:sulfotransferase [Salinibacter grassmerensis]
MAGPIFIIGRQHSGNTMLARCLGRSPDVYSATGEGTFFEHRDHLVHEPGPRRAAAILERAEGSGVEVSRETYAQVRRHMQAAGDDGALAPEEMYARCMDWVAEQNEATRWVQKATSYVFYADDIIGCFPEARLLFLARNPFDLAASMKRRGGWRAVARMTYGWNKGVRRARLLSQAHPKNLTVVRYEDFVRAPKEELKAICSFCDLPFHEEMLRIPHVNRSESPYNQSSGEKGINASRVGYYDEMLTATEAGAVRALVADRLVDEMYPELNGGAPSSLPGTSYAAILAAGAALTTSGQHLQTLLSNPRHAFQRVKRRIFA